MKLLLDENLPLSLRHEFELPIEVITVQYMQWKGRKNGELLGLMAMSGFDGIITADQRMYTDEVVRRFNLHFCLLRSRDTQLETLLPLVRQMNTFLIQEHDQLMQARTSRIISTDGLADEEEVLAELCQSAG
ncbi:hypothetical protein GCM10023189_17380 [Nibrella saemangeumensis]|uniref:DUF5615 domain-containing protein n=1 Tax=Nibrella saemangeumensis TaxID=1084526 RepID=A0ABP8MQX5_9BACT